MGFFDSYEAAIFDLDGTLIDSMHLWINFCSEWLLSLNKTPGADLETDIQTMTISGSADYVNKRYGLNLSTQDLIFQWEEVMIKRYLKGAVLKQGAADLVKALAAKGYKLGIATYSLPRACEAILFHHKIKSYFSSFTHAHEFEDRLQSKPQYKRQYNSVKTDPEFWLAAAARLGLAPQKCVVFEDSYSSLEGAKKAGMGFVWVNDSSRGKLPLLSNASDLSIDYPGEALEYLIKS